MDTGKLDSALLYWTHDDGTGHCAQVPARFLDLLGTIVSIRASRDRIFQVIQAHPGVFSLGLVAALTTALYLAFEPRWETNDDVAMSMVAHGYGLAVESSPHLIFSNALWGHAVRAIPSIGGVSGYAIATIGSLAIIGWAILYCLYRLGIAYVIALLAVALVLMRPLQFPQFTITAGLFAVAAIIALRTYARVGGTGILFAACTFAFAGFLIRQLEFVLVLFVAIPLLPWQMLLRQRETQFILPALGIAIAIAFAVDLWSYSGLEWAAFRELNTIRGQFTDFGAAARLLQHPEIMIRHGYSQNDVSLVEHWFFVDTKIASPAVLSSMFSELGRAPFARESIRSGLSAVETLAAPELLPLLLAALALLVVAPHRSVVLTWALCLVAVFAIGALGKPGAVRVYVPLVALLLVAPLMLGLRGSTTQRVVVTCTLLVGCLFNLYRLVPEALASTRKIQQVQADVEQLPEGPILIWGASFPFEYAFPPLREIKSARAPKIYGLGVFTLAPFSVGSSEYTAGRGLVQRLQSPEGMPTIALQNNVEMLRKYCLERLGKHLTETSTRETPSFTIRQLRCGEM
jgi:hypothetical protein